MNQYTHTDFEEMFKEGHLIELFTALEQYCQMNFYNDPKIVDELYLLKNRFSVNQQLRGKGTIDYKEYTITNNIVSEALLAFLSNIKRPVPTKDFVENGLLFSGDSGPLTELFVERRDITSRIISQLCKAVQSQGVPIVVQLYGVGGYGKTMLARYISRHPSIQEAYTDGFLWITLGEKPLNPMQRMLDEIEKIDGRRPKFESLDTVKSTFADIFKNKKVIIYIDDVREWDDLEPYLCLKDYCSFLITTRIPFQEGISISSYQIDKLSPAEAIELLQKKIPHLAQPHLLSNLADDL